MASIDKQTQNIYIMPIRVSSIDFNFRQYLEVCFRPLEYFAYSLLPKEGISIVLTVTLRRTVLLEISVLFNYY
jgi:hypothetical protein